MRTPKVFWLLLVLPGLFGFDFWSKDWVVRNLDVGQELPLIPGVVSLLHAQNPDVAFSLPVPLPVIFGGGILATLLIALTWWRLPRTAWVESAALGAVAAGALGNLIDRIPDGSVTDMVAVYLRPDWMWPIFNVADAALVGGVALWLIHDLFVAEGEPPDDPLEATA